MAAAGCGDSAGVAVPTLPVAGGGGGRSATAVTPRAAAAAAGGGPAIAAGYAGLGSRGSTFAGAHQESPVGRGRGVPLVTGVALDPVGRVTGYDIAWNDRPGLSDYERLISAAGVADLPRDRITVARTAACLVYGSPTLKGLIGVSYARVTTIPGSNTARVQSGPASAC